MALAYQAFQGAYQEASFLEVASYLEEASFQEVASFQGAARQLAYRVWLAVAGVWK